MKLAALALASATLGAPTSVDHGAPAPVVAAAAEARPFGSVDSAAVNVATALVLARTNGHRVILVFGANWCHDSRALAGWFATPRFAAMLRDRYEVVWINVGDEPGEKDRNGALARDFGLDGIKGTPTVLMLDSMGKPTNLADAPRWNNAASRTQDSIYDYFAR